MFLFLASLFAQQKRVVQLFDFATLFSDQQIERDEHDVDGGVKALNDARTARKTFAS